MKALCIVALALAAHAQPLKFTGELKAGEEFRKTIGRELALVLQPREGGWTIDVEPLTPAACHGYASVVAIPLRGRTALDLNTDYGIPAREAAAARSFEFGFVLNQADCGAETRWAERLMWPYQYSKKQQQEARDKFGSSARGRAAFAIRDSRVTPATNTIDWVQFDVAVTFPQEAMKLIGLTIIALALAHGQPLKFTGEVKAGEEFRKPIGRGLVFIFLPADNGWVIEVQPELEVKCRAFSTVLAFPLHGPNSNDLNTSYGMPARDVLSVGSEVAFVLNEADCQRESHWLDVIRRGELTPEYDAALANRRSSPLGKATMRILKSKISPSGELLQGKDLGKIEWIKFEATIMFSKKP